MATTPRVHTQVGWHELVAPDVERAQVFYVELFHWTLRVWRPGTHDYAMIRSGGADHGGFLAQEVEPHWLLYVEVQDADETAAQAERLGGRLVSGPVELPGVGRHVVLADPEGAEIAAIVVDEPGPPPRGVFVHDELLAADPAGAAEFYRRVLGWDVEVRRSERAAWLSYLGVDDLAAALDAAEGLGAHVLEADARRAVLVDPVGARFGLLEPI